MVEVITADGAMLELVGLTELVDLTELDGPGTVTYALSVIPSLNQGINVPSCMSASQCRSTPCSHNPLPTIQAVETGRGLPPQ